jgi:hypothetical protein
LDRRKTDGLSHRAAGQATRGECDVCCEQVLDAQEAMEKVQFLRTCPMLNHISKSQLLNMSYGPAHFALSCLALSCLAAHRKVSASGWVMRAFPRAPVLNRPSNDHRATTCPSELHVTVMRVPLLVSLKVLVPQSDVQAGWRAPITREEG